MQIASVHIKFYITCVNSMCRWVLLKFTNVNFIYGPMDKNSDSDFLQSVPR